MRNEFTTYLAVVRFRRLLETIQTKWKKNLIVVALISLAINIIFSLKIITLLKGASKEMMNVRLKMVRKKIFISLDNTTRTIRNMEPFTTKESLFFTLSLL